MGCWRMLPTEIRLVIFELVAEDYRFNTEPYARAGYARVGREWQPIFERRNFQRLVLNQDRIVGFEQFVCKQATRHRRDYLEHLFLRVRLDEYDCTVCQSEEDSETIRKYGRLCLVLSFVSDVFLLPAHLSIADFTRNNDIFSRAVLNVLVILSKWNGFARSRQHGLTLELGAYSPSDCKHTFKDFHLEHDYPYQERKDLETWWDSYRLRADRLGLQDLNEPYHGWVDGHRDATSLESKQRIMGTLTINTSLPEFSAFFQKFPKVNIVTGLLIRRHFYRKIDVSFLGKLLRRTFTCLEWFRHEGWHDVNPQQQTRFETDYKGLISKHLPSTLRELYIFEDFNSFLHPERSATRANRSLGIALSKSSVSLEIMSAAFLVDAKDFFADFWPAIPQNLNVTPWENLLKLALTSRLLHPRIRRGMINNLLMAAGRAAAFMPKLEIMEIWNGGKGHICVVRYHNNYGRPVLTWASNWEIDVQFDYDVVQCWTNLPRHRQHRHGHLQTVVLRLPRKRKHVKTYAAAIVFLRLRLRVLDVISAYQLLGEENRQLLAKESGAR